MVGAIPFPPEPSASALDTRLRIAIECAEALSYMHSQMYTQVIHGDIKPANILLDDELRAKISDFGISRLVNTEKTLYTVNVIGSIGYMDPLFAQNGRLTAKSDVYSFGVVLLELITRKKARTEYGEIGLVESFIQSLSKGFKRVRELIDPEIATSNDMKTIEEIAKLAGKCLRMEHDKRPEMLEVAERLRKLRKAPHQVQERLALFSWVRKNKQAPAETPSLESSSGSQNMKTVAPAETTPSQDVGIRPTVPTVRGQLLEPDDLLWASAEVLSMGTVGTTYRMTLDSGCVLMVKKLKDVDMPNADFEQQVTLIAAIQNKHIAPLQWYYYGEDQKLLAYNSICMGSLAKVLHGDGVSGPAPLDWEQRSAISLAVARGMAAIHLAGPSSCHGNIKSSNILLTGTHDACVSEHGLITLLARYSNASGYHAPELTGDRRVSQKADVYSFGILLLELLTRKAPANSIKDMEGVHLPRWVRSVVREEWTAEVFDLELRGREKDGEEECMVQLLWLALNCCSQYPNKRPTMPEVLQQIEEIRGKRKLGPAETPSLESSSSSQNVRNVAPAEKTPSQESSGSASKRPEMLEVAERLRKLRKAPLQVQGRLALFSWGRRNKEKLAPVETPPRESSSSTPDVGTFIVRSTVPGQLFDLDDLLRASAEVLGNGTVGTTYKATLESGYELVAKRLRNVDLPKAEFDKHVMLIGAIQNKYIVPLRWYYYSKDEKLLVYDIIPMGSLAKVLHGDGVSDPASLDWQQHSAISLAAARGMAAIHLAGPSSCHGNIKSSKILLTDTHDACVSQPGLITLLAMYSNSSGYCAPELGGDMRVSQKADVYSFGILLLELLTRKAPTNSFKDVKGVDLPQWVCSVTREEWTAEVFDVELIGRKDGEEERMVRLLQLAIDCCSHDADRRPSMSEVVMKIEEIDSPDS